MDGRLPPIVCGPMLRRLPWWVDVVLGALLGVAVGVAAGYLRWGRPLAAMGERLTALESAATEVQGERERLRHELVDIVHERREMAATAEHLREQVERQLRRLEALSAELAPPEREGEPPAP
jgi:hypothetical protein